MPILPPPYHFIFASCQVGAEATLKEEVAATYPQLRFAFSRPGFLTFKSEKPLSLETKKRSAIDLIFGRRTGISLGRVKVDQPELLAEIRQLRDRLGATLVQVWERDQFKPGEAPKAFDEGAWSREARARLLAGDVAVESRMPCPGEKILDVVVVDPTEWWLGAHRFEEGDCPHPGAKPSFALPADAPSRAYLKLREGVAWSGADLKAGDLAVEIGSAPGGAVFALLEMGLKVVGVDPGAMDARVTQHRDFVHLQMPISQVSAEDLEENGPVRWLLLDMNVSPQVSFASVERVLELLEEPGRGELRGLLLTIKLNQWRIAREIPLMLERLRELGFADARATQLANNRQEIFVYAPTRQGKKK